MGLVLKKMGRCRTCWGQALVGLVLIAGATGAGLGWIAAERKSDGLEMGYRLAQRLSLKIQEASSPAYMLGSMVIQSHGQITDFERIAEELLRNFPLAKTIELAPGGVVRLAYPLRGNEGAIGHDLLRDRQRNREAHTALATRNLAVAGPFDLIQGGNAIVARYPVFLATQTSRDRFWGFSIVLIRVQELLNAAGVMDASREGHQIELCRRLPEGNECKVFFKSAEQGLGDALTIPVQVPNGTWQLSVVREGGWLSTWEVALASVLALVVFAAWLVVFVWLISQSRAPEADLS